MTTDFRGTPDSPMGSKFGITPAERGMPFNVRQIQGLVSATNAIGARGPSGASQGRTSPYGSTTAVRRLDRVKAGRFQIVMSYDFDAGTWNAAVFPGSINGAEVEKTAFNDCSNGDSFWLHGTRGAGDKITDPEILLYGLDEDDPVSDADNVYVLLGWFYRPGDPEAPYAVQFITSDLVVSAPSAGGTFEPSYDAENDEINVSAGNLYAISGGSPEDIFQHVEETTLPVQDGTVFLHVVARKTVFSEPDSARVVFDTVEVVYGDGDEGGSSYYADVGFSLQVPTVPVGGGDETTEEVTGEGKVALAPLDPGGDDPTGEWWVPLFDVSTDDGDDDGDDDGGDTGESGETEADPEAPDRPGADDPPDPPTILRRHFGDVGLPFAMQWVIPVGDPDDGGDDGDGE